MDRQEFDESYWHERSSYRMFEDYETGLRQLARWYEGLLRLVDRHLPPPGRHLDAGCGHGALVHLLGERGFVSYGFDVSEWMIRQARAFAPHLEARFAVGNLEEGIPFDGSFDVVTCVEVLEHLASPREALERLREALSPGGRLVVTTPNLHPKVPWYDPIAADPTHVNVHDPAWWEDAVRDAGLTLREMTTYLAIPYFWRFSPRLARFVRMGRSVGPGTLLVAERGA